MAGTSSVPTSRRDVLSRLIYATRTDLPIGVLAALLPAVLGTLIGVVAGYHGGWLDGFVMRVADLVPGIPRLRTGDRVGVRTWSGTASILIAFALLGWLVYRGSSGRKVCGFENLGTCWQLN